MAQKRPAKRPRKAAAAKFPTPKFPADETIPWKTPEGWDGFVALVRGLRNLNHLQSQLLGQIEQVGKELRDDAR